MDEKEPTQTTPAGADDLHRVTPILRGGCGVRGDITPDLAQPLGFRSDGPEQRNPR